MAPVGQKPAAQLSELLPRERLLNMPAPRSATAPAATSTGASMPRPTSPSSTGTGPGAIGRCCSRVTLRSRRPSATWWWPTTTDGPTANCNSDSGYASTTCCSTWSTRQRSLARRSISSSQEIRADLGSTAVRHGGWCRATGPGWSARQHQLPPAIQALPVRSPRRRARSLLVVHRSLPALRRLPALPPCRCPLPTPPVAQLPAHQRFQLGEPRTLLLPSLRRRQDDLRSAPDQPRQPSPLRPGRQRFPPARRILCSPLPLAPTDDPRILPRTRPPPAPSRPDLTPANSATPGTSPTHASRPDPAPPVTWAAGSFLEETTPFPLQQGALWATGGRPTPRPTFGSVSPSYGAGARCSGLRKAGRARHPERRPLKGGERDCLVVTSDLLSEQPVTLGGEATCYIAPGAPRGDGVPVCSWVR
jgi:hypothetical protein